MQDNLNTHRLANLYLLFPPAEAHRLAQRFELHFTPNHASWLNMAEIEIGIVERSCLGKRVASLDALVQRIAALEAQRNAAQATINLAFYHWRCPYQTGSAVSQARRCSPYYFLTI